VVTVIVQTCPPRRNDAVATLASLRESDIGDGFEVMEHPEGMERCRFFRSVLARMAEATTRYVIRCEDDILVNRHILHNFLSWPALSHPVFGCGWLYVSELALSHETAVQVPRPDGPPALVRNIPIMYGSLCVGMPTEHAAACVALLDEWIDMYGCPLSGCAVDRPCSHKKTAGDRPPRNCHHHGQDTLISQAMWGLNKRVVYAEPALAENRLIASARGTGIPPGTDMRHLQAGPHFKPDWRRPA
jgi:hypothetical protein